MSQKSKLYFSFAPWTRCLGYEARSLPGAFWGFQVLTGGPPLKFLGSLLQDWFF